MAEIRSTLLLIPLRHHRLEQLELRQSLSLEERSRCDRKISRVATQFLTLSTFMNLFSTGLHQALTKMTRLDHHTLWYILVSSTSLFFLFTPYSKDGYVVRLTQTKRRRSHSISSIASSAWVLKWCRARKSWSTLCMLFGKTPSE